MQIEHKLKLYVDTSVIGGCFDEEFKAASNALMDEFCSGKKIIVISDLVLDELENAPDHAKDIFYNIPSEFKKKFFLMKRRKGLLIII